MTVAGASQHASLVEFFKSHLGIVVKVQDDSKGMLGLQFPPCLSQQYTPRPQFSPFLSQQCPPCLSQQYPRCQSQSISSQQYPRCPSQSIPSQPMPEITGSSNILCLGQNTFPTCTSAFPTDLFWAMPSPAHIHDTDQNEQSHLAFRSMSPPPHPHSPMHFDTKFGSNYPFCPISQAQCLNASNSPTATQVEDLEQSINGARTMAALESNSLSNDIQFSSKKQGEELSVPSVSQPQPQILLDPQKKSSKLEPRSRKKITPTKKGGRPNSVARNGVLSNKNDRIPNTTDAIQGEDINSISKDCVTDIQLRQLIVEKLKSKQFLEFLCRVDKIVADLAN